MAKPVFKKSTLSYVVIIASFFVFAYLFLYPTLEGKRLHTHDLTQYAGMAKELRDFRAKTGQEGLWTNSMFCGMPGYLISVRYPGNLIAPIINKIKKGTYPVNFIIFYFVGFFILLSSLKIDKWLSLIGAFAFALSLEIMATHYQITYYGIILLSIYVITEFIFSLKQKTLPSFLKASLFLIAGTIVAVGINFAKLYTVYEYSKQTIRGPSELTRERENRTTGLNKDYIVRWRQGIDETLSLLIPNIKGGSSNARPDKTSNAYKAMRKKRLPNINKGLNSIYLYHGEKPGTAGPVYVGAIVLFLFVMGLFLVKGKFKWWLLSATIVSVVLSWGKHIMPLTNFLLNYLPLYNKFRAPEMILVVAEFAIPLLGIIALGKIVSGQVDKRYLNANNFVSKREQQAFVQPNVADIAILKDKDISYRVLPINNAFNNTHYSYFHKNIIGYHAAKLSRPHELMFYYVVDEMEALYNRLKKQKTPTVMPPDYMLRGMVVPGGRHLIEFKFEPGHILLATKCRWQVHYSFLLPLPDIVFMNSKREKISA
ncbi:MAG: hypothetical protein J7L95_02895 [Prolixibacteraceae bacterium]|nr:hypothetical protein [Prolixibacteraceae bacterium]